MLFFSPVIHSHYYLRLLPQGTPKVYRGGSHAIHNINSEELNKDLLDWIQY